MRWRSSVLGWVLLIVMLGLGALVIDLMFMSARDNRQVGRDPQSAGSVEGLEPEQAQESASSWAPRADRERVDIFKDSFSGCVVDARTGNPLPGVGISYLWAQKARRAALEKQYTIDWPVLAHGIYQGIEVDLIGDKADIVAWSFEDGPQVAVFLKVWRGPFLCETDDEGRFWLEDVTPDFGRRILLSRPGYCPMMVTRDEVVGLSGETAVIKLSPWGRMVATVVDSAGIPMPNYEVLWRMSANGSRDTTQRNSIGSPILGVRWRRSPNLTDTLGSCTVEKIPCGVPLSVMVQCGDYSVARDLLIDMATGVGVVDFVVRPSGGVKGRVVHENSEAAAEVCVVFCKRGAEGSTTHTAVDGSFVFDDVPAGEGIILVGAGQQARIDVDVRSGEMLDAGTIHIPNFAPLQGQIISSDPVQYDQLRLWVYRHGATLALVTPDRAGAFATEIPAGEVLLILRLGGVDEVIELTRQYAVAPATNLQLVFREAVGAIHGRVPKSLVPTKPRDANLLKRSGNSASAPFEGVDCVTVELLKRERTSNNKIAWIQWQAFMCEITDGCFECSGILPGSYALLARVGTVGFAWLPEVLVRAGLSSEVGEIQIGFAKIVGRVLDSGGGTVQDVSIVARSSINPHWGVSEAMTDAGGNFVCENVACGPIDILASRDNASTWHSFVVPAGERASLDLVFPVTGRIHGRVTCAGGLASGFKVTATNLDWSDAPKYTTITDSMGEYCFMEIPGGRYNLKVGEGDSGTLSLYSRSLTLEAGQDLDVPLDIDRDPVRIQLVHDGRRVEGILSVTVTCIEASQPFFGDSRSVDVSPDGSASVDIFKGPMLVEAWQGGPRLFAVLDGRTVVSDQVSLAIGSGTVEVHLQEARDAPIPMLRLVEVPLGPVAQALGGRAPYLPVLKKDDKRLVFFSIPEGALVRLEGLSQEGERVVREIRVVTSEPVTLKWP